MKKLKYLLILLLTAGIISCGNEDKENSSENTEDESELLTEKKEESKEQPGDTSKEHQVSGTDSTPKKELRFHDKSEQPQAVISALEASGYIGKVVTVEGFVADVYKSEKVAYLNFIKKFPDNPFSGVIFSNKFDVFGDLNIYEGKNVSLTGRVTVYKEKPQIILDSKEQVKILK
jgi:DNA/RNA endonuclease YhcR with UshA esterase domain